MLANCANMSKRKGVSSPLKGFCFKDSSKRISFYFSLSLGTVAWIGVVVPDVISWSIPSGVWSYYHKYCLPERVPTGREVVVYAAKESFSPSESLREATVT